MNRPRRPSQQLRLQMQETPRANLQMNELVSHCRNRKIRQRLDLLAGTIMSHLSIGMRREKEEEEDAAKVSC